MEEQVQHAATKTQNIYAALIKAQAEFTVIRKTKAAKNNNGKVMYRYADLEDVLNSVRPALNKYGLLLMQDIACEGDVACVTTTIASEDGQTITSGATRIPAIPQAAMSKAQAFGSAITYARRYSLSAFLGISSDDDDDGQGAGNASSSPQREPAPARPAFNLTQEMVNEATIFAQRGLAAYEAYYKSQSKDWARAMFQSGTHQRLKEIAARHDKENAS